jgi:hypothetical protein
MFRRANKLLLFALVLLLGVGPVAGAMANPHVCVTGSDKDFVDESMAHAEHARQLASKDLSGQDQQSQSCADCDSGCCSSGTCSTSTCGGGAAALLIGATAQFDYSASGATALDIEQPLSERHSPPFRPPQT